MLSYDHVLAPFDSTDRATATRQPAPVDGGNHDRYNVAHYARSYFQRTSAADSDNMDDAALTRLKSEVTWHNAMPLIGAPKGISEEFQRGVFVKIMGRFAEYNVGQILDANCLLDQQYDEPRGRLRYGYVRQVLCTAYAEMGDSGAVFDAFNRVIGLHFAGSRQRSCFSPIRPILDRLHVDIAP